jgi:hypothetical protein
VAASDLIPEDLREFLRRSVHSVWALELLLLMRANAPQSWTAEQLAKELRASHAVVLGILPQLIAHALVVENDPGRFLYRPDPALGNNIARLDVIYRQNPVALVREIALNPNPKIQGFADAFKFRKE